MTVAARVIALAEHLSGREADRESLLAEDLGLDSMDRVQLAVDLERQFDIVIPDDVLEDNRMGVLSGLIAYVERAVALRERLLMPGIEL